MATKQQVFEANGVYFITVTCHDWMNLFDIADAYDAVYNWFNVLKKKGHYIPAYVIMPNHFHVLIAFSGVSTNINRVVGNGKRFMAYDIIEKLKKKNAANILNQLSQAVTEFDKKRGKLHEVFEPSFDIKECLTKKFLLQKIDYIHKNPCTGKWQLAPSPALYVHSSGGYYEDGVQGIYEVNNIMEVLQMDLTNGK